MISSPRQKPGAWSKYFFRLAATIAISFLTVACSSKITQSYQQGDSGYRIVLHDALVIAPHQARVFLQDGNVVGGLNEYHPHCSFEVRKLSEQSQTIQPDTFVVSRVQHLIEEVVMLQPVLVAALGNNLAFQDYSPSDIFRGFHFWLRSEAQPDVLRMTCRGALAPPWEALLPSPEEINMALGEKATLKYNRENTTPGSY